MSATDELRRLLDERNVEHYDGWSGEVRYTKWQGKHDMWFLTHDSFGTDGELLYVQGINMTPAQAVEATLGRDEPPYDRLVERLREDWGIDASWDGLRRFWCVQLTEEGVRLRDEREAALGRGTCTMAHEDGNDTWWSCNECDADVYLPTRPKFCWNCGREVVDG